MRKIILGIAIVFMFSCNNNIESKNDKLQVVSYKVDDAKRNNLFDYFEISKIIPLETNENSVIKDINKFSVSKNSYLFFDLSLNQLLEFDINGKFKQKVGNKGKGPDEYLKLQDFATSLSHDTIYLYDEYRHRIDVFDENRKQIEVIEQPSYYFYFEIFKKNQIVFYKCTDNFAKVPIQANFHVENFNSKKIFESYFSTENQWIEYMPVNANPMFKLPNGNISLNKHYCDTIFLYNGKNLTPRYYLDLGDYNLPFQEKSSLLTKANGNYDIFYKDLNKTKYITNTYSVWLETNDAFFTSRRGNKTTYYLLSTNNCSDNLVFDKKAQNMFWSILNPIGIRKEDNSTEIIFAVYPYQLQKLKDVGQPDLNYINSNYPKEYEKIQEMLKNLNFEDNPYLIFAKLK